MAEMRVNRAKRKLAQGQPVVCLSGFTTPDIIDFVGPLGVDAMWIEMEHGPYTWEQLGNLTRACDLWGMTSITRVNGNEPWLITRTLDQGSMGIVVPHVNTRAAAEQAAQSAKYAPKGYRGMFGGRQSFGVPSYFQQANDQSLIIVLLEEAEALRNLDAILEVPDIDVFFVAPSDLAQTMGHLGNPGHPDVQRAIDGAIAKIVAAGRTPGTLVTDETAEGYLRKGVRFFYTSWNAWLAKGAVDFMRRIGQAG